MILNKKGLFIIYFSLILMLANTVITEAAPAYESYTYSMAKGRPSVVSSPVPYVPSQIVDTKVLGVDMQSPEDIMKDDEGNFYIVDSGTNSIICVNKEWKVTKVIDTFDNNGKKDTFNKPQGAFISKNGNMYIADTENRRIVILREDGSFAGQISKPESDILPANFVFYPRKVAVDSSGRIFVVARGIYEGLMEFYSDGAFSGFIGSIPVKVDPVELFWKSIMTKEQKSKMLQFIPVEYTNLFLDTLGFLYTVSLSETNSTPIRRLNPSGQDVLIRNPVVDVPIKGDFVLDYSVSLTGPSTLIDICADDYGIYSALDSKRGRIFSYDEDGNLLFVFGGTATDQIGTFNMPSAIETDGENLIVVDTALARITIFEPTEFARLVKKGVNLYQTGNYEESINIWNSVLKLNANFDLAYSKIGRVHLREKRYDEAMKYFKLSYDKKNYSKAYFKYRKEVLRKSFGKAMSILAVIIAAIIIYKKLQRKRRAYSVGRIGGRSA